MPTHPLKCHPRWFAAVATGRKTVELRRTDDQRFAVGDTLILRGWDPDRNAYTGRTCTVRVTHLVCAAEVPDLLPPGVAALSIRWV